MGGATALQADLNVHCMQLTEDPFTHNTDYIDCYSKILIFGSYVILAILAVKAKSAKVQVCQCYMQLNEAQTDE